MKPSTTRRSAGRKPYLKKKRKPSASLVTSDPLVFHSTVSADTSASISCVPDHDIFTSVWSNLSFLYVPRLFSVTSFLPWTRTTGIKLPSDCDVTAGVISVGENFYLFIFFSIMSLLSFMHFILGDFQTQYHVTPCSHHLATSLHFAHVHLEVRFSNCRCYRGVGWSVDKCVGRASKRTLSDSLR